MYTAAMIEEALHKSLASLQTDVIDLYQVHWPGNIGLTGGPDDWKVAAGCVEALEKAKKDGLIRHWGVCNFGTEDLVGLDKAGGGGAVSNQLPYNLLCQLILHSRSYLDGSWPPRALKRIELMLTRTSVCG